MSSSTNIYFKLVPAIHSIQTFYEQEARKKGSRPDQVARITNVRMRRLYEVLDQNRGDLQRLVGHSMQPSFQGLHLLSVFRIFFLDALDLYRTHSSEKEASTHEHAILTALAEYRYRPLAPEVRKRFQAVFGEFIAAVNQVSPAAKELEHDFLLWQRIIEKSMDCLELSYQEVAQIRMPARQRASHVQLTAQEAQTLYEQLASVLLQSIAFIRAEAPSVLARYRPEATGDNWKAKPEKEARDSHGFPIDDFYLWTEDKQTSLTMSFNMLPPKENLASLLESSLKLVETLLPQAMDAQSASTHKGSINLIAGTLCRLQGERYLHTKKRGDYGFSSHASAIELLGSPTTLFKRYAKNHNVGAATLQSEMAPPVERIQARLEALQAMQTIHEWLDDLLLTYRDLHSVYTALTTKCDSTSIVAKRLIVPSIEARNVSSPPLEKVRLVQSAPKVGVTSTKKPMQRRNSLPANSVAASSSSSPTPLRKRVAKISKRPKENLSSRFSLKEATSTAAHKALWRQFHSVLPEFSKQMQQQRFQSTLSRLHVTVLHGLLEQTMAHCLPDQQHESHNLWTSFRQLELYPFRSLVADLHLGIHWSRFNREWGLHWKRWTTVPVKPRALAFITKAAAGESTQSMQSLLHRWHEDAAKLQDHLAAPKSERCLQQGVVPREKLTLEPLDSIAEKLEELPASPWVDQWRDDLRDLRGSLDLLQGAVSGDAFALLVSHSLSLLHSCVQSPLYGLQMRKMKRHDTTHNLRVLWESVDLPLSDLQQSLLKNDLSDISAIHRYPFQEEIGSSAHRLYLEALAWSISPWSADGFKTAGVERELPLDVRTGTPRLKEVRGPKMIRNEIFALVDRTMQELVQPLADALAC